MMFDLVRDFAAALDVMPTQHPCYGILQRLDEALRRDAQFIHRHPTTMFQSLWNTCWWYDSPEAAGHYDLTRSNSNESLPWMFPASQRLSPILEHWRSQKEQATPGFAWLRSLRPPRDHLNTALISVLHVERDEVRGLGVSPDGQRVATGSRDGTLRVWIPAIGFEHLRLRFRTDGWYGGYELFSVAYSPDGRRLVFAGKDQRVRIVDADSGAILHTLQGHTDEVRSVCFSPDGIAVASAGKDCTVRVWDASTGTERFALNGHTGTVTQICFSPDGRSLASGSLDGTVRLWKVATKSDVWPWRWFTRRNGSEIARITGDSTEIFGVSFSSDGQQLVFAAKDKTARVWDITRGKERLRLRGHTDEVTSAVFSPDGRRIATGSIDCTVRLWDAATGREQQRFEGHTHWVANVCFTRDGTALATSSFDGSIRLWDVTRNYTERPLHARQDRMHALTFSRNGQQLAIAVDDQTVSVWNATTGEPMGRQGGDALASLDSLGTRTVEGPWRAGTHDTDLELYEVAHGEVVAWFPIAPAKGFVTSPTGRTFAWPQYRYLCLVTLEGLHQVDPIPSNETGLL